MDENDRIPASRLFRQQPDAVDFTQRHGDTLHLLIAQVRGWICYPFCYPSGVDLG